MREKVVPIPFLGREVSAWLYRTTRWVSEHPIKATGIVALCVAGSILYEAQVTHKNRMLSPSVKNHLEYQLRPEQPMWRRLTGVATAEAETDSQPSSQQSAENDGGASAAADGSNSAVMRVASETVEGPLTAEEGALLEGRMIAAKRSMDTAKRLLFEETDPAKRAELQKLIEKEDAIMRAGNDTTLIVRSGQLLVRSPHWDLRNSERNWSILSRDQQQQKDHYWYRSERSKDDDYGRNTYSRP